MNRVKGENYVYWKIMFIENYVYCGVYWTWFGSFSIFDQSIVHITTRIQFRNNLWTKNYWKEGFEQQGQGHVQTDNWQHAGKTPCSFIQLLTYKFGCFGPCSAFLFPWITIFIIICLHYWKFCHFITRILWGNSILRQIPTKLLGFVRHFRITRPRSRGSRRDLARSH